MFGNFQQKVSTIALDVRREVPVTHDGVTLQVVQLLQEPKSASR